MEAESNEIETFYLKLSKFGETYVDHDFQKKGKSEICHA